MIPIPSIAQVKLALAVALLAGAFFLGVEWNDRWWQARIAAVERQAEADRIALAQDNADLIDEVEKRKEKVRVEIKTIYRDIVRNSPDILCTDDDRVRFGSLWNQAAGHADKPDAAVRGTSTSP